jgi:aminoglycoside phosphotransferase family enzyme/predicted kinase
MADQDEHQLVDDLKRPENLPGSAGQVEFISTHISLVFRTAAAVFKVKRAKNYGFLDYSTKELRERFCRAEVTLNRRLAPDVYLDVLPVYRDASGYSLVRPGEVVDHAVHMKRLPDDRSALSLLRCGALVPSDLERLADRLARFYRTEEARPETSGNLRASVEENFEQLRPFVGRFVSDRLVGELESLQREWLARSTGLLASRLSRDGHGDLRLEHVYVMPEGLIAIDCIEFLDRFRIADPALDVAFLAMDLARNGRRELGEFFLGRFAYESDDYDFFPLADGYMSYRACVRAKVACFLAADESTPADRARRKEGEAREYFELAGHLARGPSARPIVFAVGGLIGSGKSTVAEQLSRSTGAPLVSADATRKFLAGIPREERGGPSIYSGPFSERVREELLRRGARVLESGRPVILDTTFVSRDYRRHARELASRFGAAFLFVECRAPEHVLRERLRARTGGVSDAREDLLQRFLRAREPATELPPEERMVVDTTRSAEAAVAEILARAKSPTD